MKIQAIKEELLRYTGTDRLFIFCAMLCAFCISAEYAIIRPVCNAVFITAYKSDFLRYAWLATPLLNILAVAFYNRFLPRLGCWKMFLVTISLIATMSLACALFLTKIAILPFLFYVWKEVYIMLLFQQLWSVIHSTIPTDRAKYLYGLIFAVGGSGAIFGSMVPGFFATFMGSENLLFLTIPFYVVLTLAYRFLIKHSHPSTKSPWEFTADSIKKGVNLIRSSKTLIFILLIVLLIQVCTTLLYYQFNISLESLIGDKDLRTEYYGKLLGVISIVVVCLQLFGSFLLVHFLGLRGSHLFIPAVLGVGALGVLIMPSFAMISFAFLTIKSFDTSLFGIIKEMLYIPLKKEEKFQAKSIIDVFIYRSAKAVAAVVISLLQWISSSPSILSWGSLVLFAFWFWLAYRYFAAQRQEVIA